ncbi:MAG: hypothetical protein ATN35_10200 [Epulopiscium sp. Nele67-Bin004]|nr:MAG: hypothetical protein ATN35_10200 [Epulopiscium sp. Nele67-Bin004]
MKCFYCKGDISDGLTNHVVNYEECIIIIKNVPCEQCIQCGESFYNDEIATKIEDILTEVKVIVSGVAVFEYGKIA